MAAVVDLRLAGGGKSATVSNVGDKLNLEVWVTVTGSDSNSQMRAAAKTAATKAIPAERLTLMREERI